MAVIDSPKKKSKLKEILAKRPGQRITLADTPVVLAHGYKENIDAPWEIIFDADSVAWIGKKDEEARVRDAIPIFHHRILNDPEQVGTLVVIDLARDINLDERYKSDNFFTQLSMIEEPLTVAAMEHIFLKKKLGNTQARYLTERLARIIVTNFTMVGVRADRHRLMLPPFTILAKIDPDVIFDNLVELADFIGQVWVKALSRFVTSSMLEERKKLFIFSEESP